MMDILYTLMRRYPADFIITGRGSAGEGRQKRRFSEETYTWKEGRLVMMRNLAFSPI